MDLESKYDKFNYPDEVKVTAWIHWLNCNGEPYWAYKYNEFLRWAKSISQATRVEEYGAKKGIRVVIPDFGLVAEYNPKTKNTIINIKWNDNDPEHYMEVVTKMDYHKCFIRDIAHYGKLLPTDKDWDLYCKWIDEKETEYGN